MPRNLVVCLDGTGNQLRARGNTNVLRLYALLDDTDPDQQLLYYGPGVGTVGATGAWTSAGTKISQLLGLVIGAGLRKNLGQAYSWLLANWRPGDRIFVFGFSRGAYTARALAGMLRAIGLMRPGSENLVPYAVATYARKRGETSLDWEALHKFSEVFAQKPGGRSTIPIAYMGLWDTVKAAGMFRWDIKWPWTRKLVNVARVRHAVSIDEQRRPYREYLAGSGNNTTLEEVWFAGVHSDVGGTFDDDSRLSTISLKWVLEGAVEEGLVVNAAGRKLLHRVTPDLALGTVHRNGWLWLLLPPRRRQIPAQARIHASVASRKARVKGYTPLLPEDVIWVDPGWDSVPREPQC